MNLSHTQHSSAAARETVMKGKPSRTLHWGPVLVLRGCGAPKALALGTLGRCGVKVETTRYSVVRGVAVRQPLGAGLVSEVSGGRVSRRWGLRPGRPRGEVPSLPPSSHGAWYTVGAQRGGPTGCQVQGQVLSQPTMSSPETYPSWPHAR